jgi:hypothetical protein
MNHCKEVSSPMGLFNREIKTLNQGRKNFVKGQKLTQKVFYLDLFVSSLILSIPYDSTIEE